MEKTQEQARQEILDLVADYCRTYHINNKKPYKPGDRIPSERELSEQLQIGRNTLRAALAILEKEGIITLIGFALLIMVLIWATYNDVVRLFTGWQT